MSALTESVSRFRRLSEALKTGRIKMPPQLFVGSKPEKSKITSVKNRRASGWIKPVGGMWTSTYDPETRGSGWTDWAGYEQFPVSSDSWVVVPRPAKVYVINSLDDLKQALVRYPMGNPSPYGDQYIDFEAMAKDYDALHLTDEGQARTRMSRPGLYGWDLESTVWFRWMFTDDVQPGRPDR